MDKFFEMGGLYSINNEDIFGRGIYVNEKDIKNVAQKRFKNKDVYCTAYSYNNNNNVEESILSGNFYLDIDSDIKDNDSFNALKEDIRKIIVALDVKYGIYEESMLFYFSGCKGFHIIISNLVFNAAPSKKLNQYYKEIAKDLNNFTINKIVDTKIYDNKRLLRLVNSINGKTNLYKVPIKLKDIYDFSFEDLLEYASSPKEDFTWKIVPSSKAIKEYIDIMKKVDTPPKRKVSFENKNKNIEEVTFPKCVQAMYTLGASNGCRNNTAIVLTSCMLQQGINIEDVEDLILEWNDKTLINSLSEKEILTTIKSAYNHFINGKRYGCTSIKDLGFCENQCK